jgi:hypothetical protein
MTKTREVDEFGNVYYVVRDDSEAEIGRINKTCSAWQVDLPGGWAPVRSVKAGMEWIEWWLSLAAAREAARAGGG